MRAKVVRLKPTPSPEYLPHPLESPSPDPGSISNHKGPKRRPKTQASQGDAVLIGFLGSSNFPDIAIRAGEEPLNSASQSESGEPSDRMDEGDGTSPAVGDKNINLVQTAQEALPLLDGTVHSRTEDLSSNPRVLSKIFTRDLLPSATTSYDAVTSNLSKGGPDGQATLYAKDAAAAGNVKGVKPFLSRLRSPPSSKPSHASDSRSSFSGISKFVLSEGTQPPETKLPAMSLMAKKSPQGQQLPSLQKHLESLGESPTLGDSDVRPNGVNSGRHTFPLPNSPLHSPTVGSITSRPSQYPSPHIRLKNPFPAYSPQSPASAYSDASPREIFRQNQDPSVASPLSKFVATTYYSGARGPQSEDLTPLSAESYASAGHFSAETSPNGDHINMEGRPVLPPLKNIPLITGIYKCDFNGCTAQPFQTQYLLNSHKNVHSQNRPHYCPVKTCNRSEGGKGFKRKNEMIRHGLVHQSPGYICPFCPEREHKYPRPDNLQSYGRFWRKDWKVAPEGDEGAMELEANIRPRDAGIAK